MSAAPQSPFSGYGAEFFLLVQNCRITLAELFFSALATSQQNLQNSAEQKYLAEPLQNPGRTFC